jgi:hypothetical protein
VFGRKGRTIAAVSDLQPPSLHWTGNPAKGLIIDPIKDQIRARHRPFIDHKEVRGPNVPRPRERNAADRGSLPDDRAKQARFKCGRSAIKRPGESGSRNGFFLSSPALSIPVMGVAAVH